MAASRVRLSAQDRRTVTVDAVLSLAATQSPAELTTAAIAEKMGVTQGALFRHFTNKEALWLAVMEWVSEQLLKRANKALASSSSALLALEAVFLTHAEFVTKHPGVPRLLFNELQQPEDSNVKRLVCTMLSEYAEKLIKQLMKAQTEGDVPMDLDLAAAATLFLGSIQGLVMQSLLANKPALILEQAPAVFAVYLRGIQRCL